MGGDDERRVADVAIAEIEAPKRRPCRRGRRRCHRRRYWELEPYFELDGGRAVALSGVEYLVYIEKPGR